MAKNRPLRAVYRRLDRLDQIIREIIDEKGSADVLEVGCGLGLPMLELKKKFGDKVALTGINKHPEFNQPEKALWEGVRQFCFLPWEPYFYKKRYGYPSYTNCDASLELPFADNSFDLIYSIATTFFLTDKLHFLQEVNRVLRPNCMARIHFSYSAAESCHAEQLPPPPYDNLCEIRDSSGLVIEFGSFVESHEFLRIIEQTDGRPSYLQLTKLRPIVQFKPKLVEGYFLTEKNPNWVAYAKSVYKI